MGQPISGAQSDQASLGMAQVIDVLKKQGTTTIACDAERVVFAYEGGGRFRLVKLTVIHSGNQPANIIEANSGIIELEDCVFRGAVWSEEKKLGGNGVWLHGVVRA
ncbi:MAG: hypothetical protein RMJ82_14035, partial [Gemmatales bacterium]|nr:hypothetical protein [Gemmatales bacterium]